MTRDLSWRSNGGCCRCWAASPAFSGTHICPRCFSVLSGSAGPQEDGAAEVA